MSAAEHDGTDAGNVGRGGAARSGESPRDPGRAAGDGTDDARSGSETTRASSAPRPAAPRPAPARGGWFAPMLLRLHFFAGVLVGPFILVAALTGAAYALTPSIERVVYADELTVPAASAESAALPLADQIEAAEQVVGDDGALVAVRPAPEAGDTTRVMFTGDDLIESQTRAIFVDPATAEVRGDLPVYGTSGALPLRTAVSDFHRSLGLGDAGRLYSELAASWLGVVVVAGAGLWLVRWRAARRRTRPADRARARRGMLRPDTGATGHRRIFSWHASTGIWLLIGALFLSATGITWSQFAGENVTGLRSALSWSNPALTTALPEPGSGSGSSAGAGSSSGDAADVAADPHAGHHGVEEAPLTEADPTTFDAVLEVARTVNVNTGLVEIKPPADAASAWTVTEIQRSFPTEVDAVAVDGSTLEVVGRTDFADYPVMAKLARWGVDTHMGSMFGLANQLLLAVTALGIAVMVVFGYLMWWKRRPTRAAGPLGTGARGAPRPGGAVGAARLRPGAAAPAGALARAPWWGVALVLVGGGLLALFLPLLGVTLVVFVVGDALWVASRR
ncbi:PepSY-associated TM helix domain-containing protein [Frigoribacterium sp. Leaf263]|uniref:PepSY-associated TM helix domain-containing protein n=1 Tax=Frigoribacterium sp. Leaf263 TaxID=1736313 RepID=UPI0009E983D0|nr:PepSY-associated TM helix domain-containing protein [Frigoribacterium sp. Leaf263]